MENKIKEKIKTLDKNDIIKNINVKIGLDNLWVSIWLNGFFLIDRWKDNTMFFDIDSKDTDKSMIYDDTVDRPEDIVNNIDIYINTIKFYKKNKEKIRKILKECINE